MQGDDLEIESDDLIKQVFGCSKRAGVSSLIAKRLLDRLCCLCHWTTHSFLKVLAGVGESFVDDSNHIPKIVEVGDWFPSFHTTELVVSFNHATTQVHLHFLDHLIFREWGCCVVPKELFMPVCQSFLKLRML